MMDYVSVTILATLLIFVFMAAGVPVFASLAISGIIGIGLVEDYSFVFNKLKSFPYHHSADYLLTVIPLFILMGSFAHQAGVGERLFSVARKWVGHLPGGLAMASVLTCAGFAATSGSSVATAATVGSVAIPEMKKSGYDPRLSAGCIAAGGVLGVLIPPSVLLIFYAALTDVSAGRMLIAGIIPGLLSTAVFIIGIWCLSLTGKTAAARLPRSSWKERVLHLRGAWQVLILFVIVIGGIYAGLATPTEAGAVGAFAAFVMLLFSRNARPELTSKIVGCFRSSITTTVMILLAMIGAGIFSYFLSLVQIPQLIAGAISDSGVHPLLIIGLLLLLYLPLGMFLDAFSMLVITLPVVFPTISALGFDPIWFGILAVKMCEIGLITPPIGLNVYVIAGIDKETPLSDIFRGAGWFMVMEIVTTLLIFMFPVIVTFLPAKMMG